MSAVLLNQGILYINDYDRFEPGYLLEEMVIQNIETLCAPKSILKKFIQYIKEHPNIKVPTFSTISSAGEKVDGDLRQEVKKFFYIDVYEWYGMTEAVLPLYENESGNNQSLLYDDVSLEEFTGNGLHEYEIVLKGGKIGMTKGYLRENNESYLNIDYYIY